MATYGVKYELKFSDNRGHKRTLEILKKDYEGELLPIVGTDTPVVIRYENQDDFYNPIIGSSCIINLKTTDNVSYDEFANFNEREYKVRLLAGQEDDTITVNSPLWETANTNWEGTETLWASGDVFSVYWEGFLVFDNYIEQLISNPYDITLRAIDNVGTLDSYNVPYGNVNVNAQGNIEVLSGDQNNYDSAFYYIKEILKLTGLEFDIYIQNNIRRKIFGVVNNQALTLFHDIYIHEFALTDDFVRKNAKDVLKEILRVTNSRIFQANASWYIVSNHNYYDNRVVYDGSTIFDTTTTTTSTTTTSTTTTSTTSTTQETPYVVIVGPTSVAIGQEFTVTAQTYNFTGTTFTWVGGASGGKTGQTLTLTEQGSTGGRTYQVTVDSTYVAYFFLQVTFDVTTITTETTTSSTTTTTIAGTSEQPSSVPLVSTNPATSITSSTATLNGEILDDRGLAIINRGFYLGTNSVFSQNTKYNSTDTTDAFTFSATGLVSGQEYYFTAFASNSAYEEGVGATRKFVAETTTITTEPPRVGATVITNQPLASQVFDTKMTLRGEVEDIGTSNVTEYGFYFGTDSFNFENNTKYAVETSVSKSSPFTYTLDTSTISPTLTLTAGTAYYITSYAINTAGETIGNTVQQQTYNVWNLYNIETNEIAQAIYDDTYVPGDGVRLSDSGTSCFTIIQGTTISNTSGLPTISAVCPNEQTTEEVTTEEISTCIPITLFRASTADAVCCNEISVETFYINGEAFLLSDTTAVYTDSACTNTADAQFFTRDTVQYRYFDGTTLGAATNCPDCGARGDDPNAYIAENNTTGERVEVLFSTLFDPGDDVVISTDSDSCYTIVGSVDLTTDPTITISRACDIVTTEPPETCPTMEFFAEYQGCGDDNFVIIGNNKNELPNIVKQISTDICFFKVRSITTDVQNNDFNLGCFPTAKFELGNLGPAGSVVPYVSCDDCTGVATTQPPTTTTTTTAAPTIFYRRYLSLTSSCTQDDVLLEVSNQTNSFPSIISNGVVCFSSHSDGGSGVDGDVDTFLNFDDCDDCQLYLGTTTTPAPITTQPPCQPISVYLGSTALEACCGGRSVTVYGNGLSIAQSTVIYTDFVCSEIVTPGEYVRQGGATFFWNGYQLTQITCPACP